MPSILQASLVGGELAPALWGRTDLERYLTSLALCRNMVVQPYGGTQNRAGLVYCATVKNSGVSRLIPFNYNISQSNAMEFGAGYIRFHSYGAPVVLSAVPAAYSATTTYAQGAYVLSGGVAYYCVQGGNYGEAVTNTAWWYPLTSFVNQFGVTEYIVEIPTPYSATDIWALNFTQSFDVVTLVHPNYAPMQLNRYASDTWTLTPFAFVNGPFLAMNIDQTNTIFASAITGTVTLTSSAGIFLPTHVGRLLQLQDCSFGYAWEPQVAITQGMVRRSQGNYYMATNSGTTGTVIPSHVQGVMSDGSGSGCILWQFLDSGWGIAQITAVTSATTATATVLSQLPMSVVGTGNTAIAISSLGPDPWNGRPQFVTATPHGYITGQSVVFDVPWVDIRGQFHTFMAGGSVVVLSTTEFDIVGYFSMMFPYFSALTGSPTVNSVGTNTTGITPGPTYNWAWGAWGGTYGQPGGQGWPSTVEYFQQRQVFGGTPAQPQTVWMSRTGSYVDFGLSNPIVDDDSITFTIATKKGNAIKEILALGQLMMLTDGAEFELGQNPQDVITPSNVSTTLQGFHGGSALPALQVHNGGIFIQGNNRTVRGINYDFASNSFTGNDLMVLASHLTDGLQIVDWAYQQDPLSCAWSIRSDGELLGLTYMPEQQVSAWHRHDTVNGAFESVCCVDENTAAAPYQNTPYFIVNRTINGQVQRTIEYFAPRLITDVRDSVIVDCSMTYDGRTGYRGTPWNLTAATVKLTGGTNWDNTDASITVTSSIPFFQGAQDIGSAIVFEDLTQQPYLADGITPNPLYGVLYKLVLTSASGAPGVPGATATGVLNGPLAAQYQNTAQSAWYLARNTFSGMTQLAGQTVAVLADGNVAPQQVVSSTGTFTIPNPAFVITAGLPITAQLQTLPIVIPGIIDTNRDKWKLINSVRIMINESRGLWAGPDFQHLLPQKSRSFENYDKPPNLISDLVPIYIQANWVKFGQVCIQTTDPLPLSVLSIIPDVSQIGGT